MTYSGQGRPAVAGKSKRRGGKRKKRGGKNRRVGPPRMGPPRRRPKGHCLCPSCGTKVAVYTEVPCYIMHCSKCGTQMVKGSSGKNPQHDVQPR
jgi:ribosomal protein S27E